MLKADIQSAQKGLDLILLLLIALLLGRLLWLLLLPPPSILPAAQVTQIQSRVSIPQRLALATQHLFGEYTEKQQVSHFRNAPETPLNLVLHGIVSGETDQDGFAIIRNSRGKEAVYRVGAALPGGGEVRGVFADRVVLLRDGKYETLRLRLDDTPVDADGEAEFAVTKSTVPASKKENTSGLPLGAGSLPGARSRYTLNVPAMAGSYGLVKQPAGGYRISLGRNARQLLELGLRNGDVIISANGVSLDDEKAVEALITRVMQGEGLSLEILRHGRRQILRADIDSLLKSQ